MIIAVNTLNGSIGNCAHDGEKPELFDSIEDADLIIKRWFENHGADETYEIVVYRNEEQRQLISKLSGCGEY
jgi:hypothetical protein